MTLPRSILVLLLAATCCVPAMAAPRPNIVVILSDDHPVSAISAYGSKHVKTPNIDRLAAGGVRFDDVFCVNSICGPSRASILTGLYPHRHGQLDNYHHSRKNLVTYPALLADAGYRVALFGKTHMEKDSDCLKSMDHYMISHGAQYHDPNFVSKGETKRRRHKGYVTDIITDEAIKWLDGRDREKDEPVLLMVHHPAAHMPFQESAELKDRFADTVFAEPASFDDPDKNRTDSPRPDNITIPGGLMRFQGRKNVWGKHAWDQPPAELDAAGKKSWVYQRLMRAFMSCVVSLDDNVGRLVKHIESEPALADNTIIIYSSDQGFFLGEHGWYDKRFIYEESIRMPLIVSGPGLGKPHTTDEMVLNIDLAPTLLELAGAPVPEAMQGRSIVPLLKAAPPADWRKSMLYHFYENRKGSPLPVRRHYGVRTERHKLVRFYGDREHWELFDLEADPAEMTNLYDAPGQAATVRNLRAELFRLREFYGDATGPAAEPPAPSARFIERLRNGEKIAIATMGTSLTGGRWRWVDVMKAWLDHDFPKQVALHNFGVGASASERFLPGRSGLDILPKVAALKPDVVFIEFATNDSHRPYKISPAASRRNLNTIVDGILAKNPNAEIILQTMNSALDVPGHAAKPASDRPEVDTYFENYRAVARARGLRLIDHHKNWRELMEKNQAKFIKLVPDGIHPQQAGYREILLPQLKRSLLGER